MGRPPLPQPPTAASYLRVGRTAARRRAEATGAQLEWREADAEHLPFDDEEFDVVMSCIGAMCAPHHRDVADELVRVCRPGGFVGLASWTPEGMIGALFRVMRPFRAASSSGRVTAPLWGSEEHLHDLFGDRSSSQPSTAASST